MAGRQLREAARLTSGAWQPCNAHGLIHGGLIAALADNAMAYSCAHQMGWTSYLPTVSLAVDFVGTANVGQWLTVETDVITDVIKTGSTICFAQSFIKADDVVITRQCDIPRGAPN